MGSTNCPNCRAPELSGTAVFLATDSQPAICAACGARFGRNRKISINYARLSPLLAAGPVIWGVYNSRPDIAYVSLGLLVVGAFLVFALESLILPLRPKRKPVRIFPKRSREVTILLAVIYAVIEFLKR